VPAGPIVLGLLLGPLAEENLSRTLAILPTRPFFEVISPITIILLTLAVLSIVMPAIRNARKPRGKRGSLSESILADEVVADIAAKHSVIDELPDPVTGMVPIDPSDIHSPAAHGAGSASTDPAVTDTKENEQ